MLFLSQYSVFSIEFCLEILASYTDLSMTFCHPFWVLHANVDFFSFCWFILKTLSWHWVINWILDCLFLEFSVKFRLPIWNFPRNLVFTFQSSAHLLYRSFHSSKQHFTSTHQQKTIFFLAVFFSHIVIPELIKISQTLHIDLRLFWMQIK